MIAKTLQTVALLALLSGLGFVLYQQATPLFASPCKNPLPYYVESYDERFGIGKEELVVALLEAEKVWEEKAGRDLFVLSNAGMAVRLQYGKEQRTADLGEVISKEQENYDAKKAEVEELKFVFERVRAIYERKAKAFDELSALYHEQINYWNSRGGAPEKEYEKVTAMREELEKLRASLNAAAEEANSVSDSINARVGELNAYARLVNTKVEVYNEHAGDEFDQGEYKESEKERSITVYEFDNTKDLTRVLAHEFGHALGIGHVENPSSIMYSYNVAATLELSEEDMAALVAACELDSKTIAGQDR